MAFNTTEGRAEYLASSGQTVFSFNFRIFKTSDVLVYKTTNGIEPNEEDDLLTETTDYTVTIDGANGGFITLTTGAVTDDAVTIQRSLEINRLIEYQERGDLTASNLNDDQEYQTYLIADQGDKESRSLVFDKAAQNVDGTVPAPVALNFLQWNSNGTRLQNVNSLQMDGFIWTAAEVYTQTEIDVLLDLKADQDTTYTKSEVDLLVGTKVRQTVNVSTVDANGYPDFISIGTGLAVDIAATTIPLSINASGGLSSNDRLGTLSADTSIAGLTASDTNYLYADIDSLGAVTLGHTILEPVYQFGGTYSIVLDQATFNTSEMTMKVGDGATANQAYRVFIGEAVTDATTVTSVVNYALNGLYDSGWTPTLPNIGVAVSKNHNVGTYDISSIFKVQCLVAEFGYSIGDIVYASGSSASAIPTNIYEGKNTVGLTVNAAGRLSAQNKTTGTNALLTLASWSYKFISKRNF